MQLFKHALFFVIHELMHEDPKNHRAQQNNSSTHLFEQTNFSKTLDPIQPLLFIFSGTPCQNIWSLRSNNQSFPRNWFFFFKNIGSNLSKELLWYNASKSKTNKTITPCISWGKLYFCFFFSHSKTKTALGYVFSTSSPKPGKQH